MGELQESIGAVFLPLMAKLIPVLNDVANYMAENTEVIIVLMGVVGSLAGAIVAANLAMKTYAGTVKAVEIANTLLANSFTSLQTSVGVLATGIGIAAITLQAFYELFREGPEAIRQTIQPFKDFARFTVATVATIGNGVLDAVQLVVNGINTMVNAAIDALNLVNPFNDIDKVPMINLPNIPVPTFGGGSYFSPTRNAGIFAPPNPPRSGGTMPGVNMPSMPSPVAPLSSGGGGGGGSRSQGPSFSGGSGGPSIDTQGQLGSFDLNLPANFTINVSGGISTSAEIGKSVVDAINQYTQVYGPVRFATA